MKFLVVIISIALGLVLASCGEPKARRAARLKLEAVKIQNETAKTIVMEDMRFMIDLDERDQLFARLRKDMDRCKSIADELRMIDPGSDLADLEKSTKLILLRITIDEERNKNRRRISESRRYSPRGGEARSTVDESIAEIERTIELIEEAGEDAGDAKRQLEIFRKMKAEEDSGGKAIKPVAPSLSETVAGVERTIKSFEDAGLDANDAKKFLKDLKKAEEDGGGEAAKGSGGGAERAAEVPEESEEPSR